MFITAPESYPLAAAKHNTKLLFVTVLQCVSRLSSWVTENWTVCATSRQNHQSVVLSVNIFSFVYFFLYHIIYSFSPIQQKNVNSANNNEQTTPKQLNSKTVKLI